ncbi:MAG TPA: hypothetical protein VH723_04330 [Candidatus Limnocylindrales bacterium]
MDSRLTRGPGDLERLKPLPEDVLPEPDDPAGMPGQDRQGGTTMTDRPTDPAFRPAMAAAAVDEVGRESTSGDDDLPDHERDADNEVGGGIMSAGGTATETGLGRTTDESRQAAAREPFRDAGSDDGADALSGDPRANEPDEIMPNTRLPG